MSRFLVVGRYTPYNGSWRPRSLVAALGPFTSEEVATRRAFALTEQHGIDTTVVDLHGARQVEAFVAALTVDDDPRCPLCAGSGLAIDPARVLGIKRVHAGDPDPEPTCARCGGKGLVSLSGRGSDGPDPCPDCRPEESAAEEKITDLMEALETSVREANEARARHTARPVCKHCGYRDGHEPGCPDDPRSWADA